MECMEKQFNETKNVTALVSYQTIARRLGHMYPNHCMAHLKNWKNFHSNRTIRANCSRDSGTTHGKKS